MIKGKLKICTLFIIVLTFYSFNKVCHLDLKKNRDNPIHSSLLFSKEIDVTGLYSEENLGVLKNQGDQINTIRDCNTVESILNAMKNAQPGDEILIASGTYIALEKDNTDGRASLFFSGQNGTENQPIIIRAKDPLNPPILKGVEGRYDGYVMRIIGDYWQIKDLILEDGSKGLVFDNANYGVIENITVRDIGEEGIHLRDGSSNNIVRGCTISNTGVKKPGFGEGLYVGSDKSQHNDPYDPDCDNNTIENCIIGPYVAAEAVDVKEGTTNTIIRNCTFSAKGISGENSADAFIDLKGSYTFVYDNTFNLDKSTVINAAIDFQDRKTGYKTGFRNAIFNNTFNLENRGADIPTMRAKGGKPSEIHFFNNTRNPNTTDPISGFSLKAMVLSCPSWNIEECDGNDSNNKAPTIVIDTPNAGADFLEGATISIKTTATDSDGTIDKVEFYNNDEKLGEDNSFPYEFSIENAQIGNYSLMVKAIDNEGAIAEANITLKVKRASDNGGTTCLFNTPSDNALPTFNDLTFFNVHVIGTNGPDLSSVKKFRINWNSANNRLGRFAINTSNGVPSYYIDLKKKMTYSFSKSMPEVTISNSGISKLDNSYWVTEDNGNFVMVSKNGSYTIYFSNSVNAPKCIDKATLLKVSKSKESNRIKIYPNPVRNEKVTIVHASHKRALVTIVDMQGKIILKQELQNNATKTILDISFLKTGLYVVSVLNKSILLSKL